MKKIKLTQGKFAIVDDEDFEYLNRFYWQIYKSGDGIVYPVRAVPTERRTISIRMVNLIVNGKKGHYLRHINGDRLDCRKENLELLSTNHKRQLRRNINPKDGRTSIYRGVYRKLSNGSKCWVAQIGHKNERIHIGNFYKEKDAARAYNKRAREIYGDLAYQSKI